MTNLGVSSRTQLDPDLAIYLDLIDRFTEKEKKAALERMIQTGFISQSLFDSIPNQSWKELLVLEAMGKSGMLQALIAGLELFKEEISNPHYPGAVGTGAAMRTIFLYAIKHGQVRDVSIPFFDLVLNLYLEFPDDERLNPLNTFVEVEEKNLSLAEIVPKDVQFSFQLHRLKFMRLPVSGYAVDGLLRLDPKEALTELATTILQTEIAGKIDVAKVLIQEGLKGLDPSRPYIKMVLDLKGRQKWVDALKKSLRNVELIALLEAGRRELEAQQKRADDSKNLLSPENLEKMRIWLEANSTPETDCEKLLQ